MWIELRQIDTSCLQAFQTLDHEAQGLRGLLEKAESLKHKVPSLVFDRVVQDYTNRLQALDAQASRLKARANSELARITVLHERLQAALEYARLGLQEVEFRREVGELDDESFERRRKAAGEIVADCEKELDDVERVSARFAEAMPGARGDASTSEPTTIKGMKSPVPAGAVETGSVPAGSVPAGPVPAEVTTLSVPSAQLVPDPAKNGLRRHVLSGLTLIGRTVDNQIPIDSPDVSRRHARIALTHEGFVLTDLNSGNGTYVNGARVSECALRNGDRVQFGKSTFVFQTL